MPWDKTGGEGIWTEHTNDETGEKSLKTHTLKVVKNWCAKGTHDYRIVDGKARLAVCSKCQQELHFIIGVHKIDGNKVFA